MPDTTLDQLVATVGFSSWDEAMQAICEKCSLKLQCAGKQECAARKALGVLGSIAATDTVQVHLFAKNLKGALNNVHNS